MVTSSSYLEAPRWLRAFVRAHETSLVALAALVGVIGGLVVAAMGAAVEGLHVVLFNIEMGDRLSSQFRIEAARALLVECGVDPIHIHFELFHSESVETGRRGPTSAAGSGPADPWARKSVKLPKPR